MPTLAEIADARQFIRELRIERGAENDQERDASIRFIVNELDRSIKVLSEDLYTTPTHFLLELVQNADDNSYDARRKPFLRFKLLNDYLQIDCNEVGFTQRNIHAICRIGHSTKSSEMKAKGYIGEKGLGFKSVFKVAETVWISSHAYQFKFEKTQRLGMITPIWAEMPKQFRDPNYTQILLKIIERNNIKLVQQELENFDPSLIIFLRKLKEIELCVSQTPFKIVKSEDIKFSGQALNLETINENFDPPKKTSQKYLVERYKMEFMPVEEKRPNISESEIVIAFPFSYSKAEPIIRTQRVHNFLPIGDFGFSFLIQADFLLTANREGIHDSNAWNNNLVSGIAFTFAQAVDRFNRTKEFKYKWPSYLPQHSAGAGTLLQILREKILNVLSTKDCLEAQDGSLTKPAKLFTVNKVYYDSAGEFLLGSMRSKSSFISHSYVHAVIEQFRVPEYSSTEFVQDLLEFSTKNFSEFMKKPPDWHSAVCKALLTCLSQLETIKKIPLIPLRDNSWVHATTGHIFFDDTNVSEIKIPNGLEVSIVEADASADIWRRNLLQKLGAECLDKKQICQLILERHSRMQSPTWPLSVFVEHAYYLFCASRTFHISDRDQLWLVDRDMKTAKGKELYIEAPSLGLNISKHFEGNASLIRLLHPDYLAIERENTYDWVVWLCGSLGLTFELRLKKNAYHLSEELNWLILNRSNECLKILRDLPAADSSFLINNALAFQSRMKVKCLNGKENSIKNVLLPRSSIKRMEFASEMLPFIDLPDPEDERWLKFRHIGLIVELDLKYYIEYLKNMHTKKCSVDEVKDIYKEIEKRHYEGKSLVYQTFRSHKVIYIARNLQRSPEWVDLSRCRWKTPACLKKVFSLSDRYSACKILFTTFLSIKDASTDDIITELIELADDMTKVDSIKDLLIELSTSLKHHKLTDAQYNRLNGVKIFPTYKESKGLSTRGDPWFIVDRSILERCFKGRVLLLDFEPSHVHLLQPLLEGLKIPNWTLSHKVTETLSINGDIVINALLTDSFSHKAKFFASLVSEGTRSQILGKFQEMKVFCATKIVVERKCHIKTKVSEEYVQGEDDEGDVVLLEKDDQLHIYFSAKDVRSGDLPWADLASKICEFCEINERSWTFLVLEILMTRSHQRIRASLEKNGIHVDYLFKRPNRFVSSTTEAEEEGNKDEIEDEGMEDNFGEPILPNGRLTTYAPTGTNSLNTGHINGEGYRQNTQPTGTQENRLLITDEAIIQAADSAQFNRDQLALVSSFRRSIRAHNSSALHTTGTEQPRVRSLRSGKVYPDTDKAFQTITNPTNVATNSHTTNNWSCSGNPSSQYEKAAGSYSSTVNESGNAYPPALHTSYDLGVHRLTGVSSTSKGYQSTQSLPIPRTEKELARDQRIGYLGELYIFTVFRRHFGDTEFNAECWTSANRRKAGFAEFEGSEMEYSDFTFIDKHDKLSLLPSSNDAAQVTLHFEIKSTVGPNMEEPFHMSYYQQQLARRWSALNQASGQISDLYVIVRVYNLEDKPQYCIYADPWKLFIEDKLEFQPDGGFLVLANHSSSGSDTINSDANETAAGTREGSNGVTESPHTNSTPATGATTPGDNAAYPIMVDEDEEL